MDFHIRQPLVVRGVEVSTSILAEVPSFYGGKVGLHAGHQHVASLANILFATGLASDTIHQIGALASDIRLTIVG